MCTAAIGPILNAGVSIMQMSAARAAEYERAREQQRQYEQNAALALRGYNIKQSSIDKQTVEQVRETNMAAFDQIMEQRDTLAQARAVDASVGRVGGSVNEVYGAINQMGSRNVGRLAHRRSMLVEYGQDSKLQAQFEADSRINSVQQGRVSQAALMAATVNGLAGIVGAFNQGWSNMQQSSMTTAQMNYQQGYFENSYSQNMMMSDLRSSMFQYNRSRVVPTYGGQTF